MKKRNLFLTVIACLLLVSCDKNDNSPAVEQAPFVVSELTASDDMLSFSSMEELDGVVGSLLRMNSTEQASWYSTKGVDFTSLEQIYNSAVDDFSSFVDLGIEDLSIAEKIKSKYVPYLLFNNNPEDEELYLPVIPSELFGKSLVTNKNGDVLVGGKVLNFNDIESVVETNYYMQKHMSTKILSETINNVFVNGSHRKMWAETYRINGGVAMYLYCHSERNSWFGWIVDRTTYFVRSASFPSQWSNWTHTEPWVIRTSTVAGADYIQSQVRNFQAYIGYGPSPAIGYLVVSSTETERLGVKGLLKIAL